MRVACHSSQRIAIQHIWFLMVVFRCQRIRRCQTANCFVTISPSEGNDCTFLLLRIKIKASYYSLGAHWDVYRSYTLFSSLHYVPINFIVFQSFCRGPLITNILLSLFSACFCCLYFLIIPYFIIVQTSFCQSKQLSIFVLCVEICVTVMSPHSSSIVYLTSLSSHRCFLKPQAFNRKRRFAGVEVSSGRLKKSSPLLLQKRAEEPICGTEACAHHYLACTGQSTERYQRARNSWNPKFGRTQT
jgi:hypothetical protein